MNHKNIGAGLLFLIVGLFFSITTLVRYQVGTPGNMGTGFLPLSVGSILCFLGLITIFRDRDIKTRLGANFKIPLKLTLMIISFVILFKFLGAIVASIFLVFGSAYLHPNFEKTKTVYVALVIILLILIFKFLLNTPIPLWIS